MGDNDGTMGVARAARQRHRASGRSVRRWGRLLLTLTGAVLLAQPVLASAPTDPSDPAPPTSVADLSAPTGGDQPRAEVPVDTTDDAPDATVATTVVDETSVDVGTVPVGSSSDPMTVTVSNVGTASLSGQGAGDSRLSITPETYDFGQVPVGSSSAPRTFTVTNDGSEATSVTIDLSGPMEVDHTTTCSSLAAGSSCTITVTFRPTEPGETFLWLNVIGASDVVSAGLEGVGVGAPVPVVSVSPVSLVFGEVMVGSVSASETVTISNGGTAAASTVGVSASGPFVVDGSCGSIAVGSSCEVSVSFVPTVVGAASGTLTVSGEGFDDVTVALSGTGGAPLSVSPVAVDFGLVTVGHGVTETVTVTNRAGSAVPVSVGDVSSPFGRSTSCGAVLDAGASCSVTVSFTPVGDGVAGSSLTVRTPVDGSVQSVDVAVGGTGVVADVAVSDVDFGDVGVGESGSATATVRNDGDAAVTISTVATSAPFAVVDEMPCVTVLEPGAECRVDVTFTPTDRGDAAGTLTVTHPAGTSTATVSGRGIEASLDADESLDFGAVLAGGTRELPVTFTNSGNVDLTLQPATATGPFSVVAGCTGTLAAGASCDLTVQFAPGSHAAGPLTGELSLTGAASGLEATSTVDLEGFAATAELTVSPTAHDFGTIALDRSTPTRPTTITNEGNVAVTVSVTLTGQPDFAVDAGDCDDQLDPGGSCSVTLTYQPTSAASHSGSLSVSAATSLATGTHEFSGEPVALVGAAAAVDIHADGPLDFGDVPAGEQSSPLGLTITNDGPEVGVTGVEAPAGFAIVDDTCTGTTLARGATCTIDVVVSSTADGEVSGDIIVSIDTGDNGLAVSAVSAVAVSGSLTVSPDTVDFTDTHVGDIAEQDLTITNGLNVATELTDLSLTARAAGTGAAGYSRPTGLRAALAQAAVLDGPFRLDPGDCADRVLEPGESCTLTLRFAPETPGTVGAVLSIVASRASADIELFGSAVAAPAPPTEPSPPTDPGDEALPATGAATAVTTVALALILLGAGALLVTVRRRAT